MESEDTALWVILAALALRTLAEALLNRLNANRVSSLSKSLPEEVKGLFDEKTWKKSTNYTLAKSKVGLWEELYDALLFVPILAFFMPWAYESWSGGANAGPWRETVAVATILVLLQIPELPFEWYKQFRLEERFGFNKSTLGLWISDKVKGTVLGFGLGYGLIGLLLWIYSAFHEVEFWWLWGFGAFFAFQLLLFALWPMFILPLFNKLEPLEEGELKDKLMSLADKAGFKAKTIEVMDGSKRSGHSNAFFTGFGKFRRIVLFDTLIEQLEHDELEAVLAHEIGHYKLGHVPKRLALSGFFGLASFWLIAYLTKAAWFYEQLGYAGYDEKGLTGPLGPVFLVMAVASGVFTFWLGPIGNLLSRKHEYEADAFARDAVGGPETLVSALRKMYVENLSHPLPHPLFATVYHSHPTLPEREAALRGGGVN